MLIEIPSDDLEEALDLLTIDEVIVFPIRISQILFSVWKQQRKCPIKGAIETLPADHEWVKWASESVENYELLWNFGMDVLDEHAKLYGEVAQHPYVHGSFKLMEELGSLPPLPAVGLTEKPKATI
jgi:hypothetical protein